MVFINFRPDRARQITRAFIHAAPEGAAMPPVDVHYVCMTEYDSTFRCPVAFPPESIEHPVGQVVAEAGLRQLRIAETEKYAHVTYFFNGGRETPFHDEDRALIPSPKVATYDLQPEMSAVGVTDELLRRLSDTSYDLVVLNFANPDMVGHTGVLGATIQALEVVDGCVGRIVDRVREMGGATLITGDHGNAEQMIDDDGGPFTAHTTNPVHLILVDDARREARLRDGIFADVAPTMLALLGLAVPAQMTGTSFAPELRMRRALEAGARVTRADHVRGLGLLEIHAAQEGAGAGGHLGGQSVALASKRDQHGSGAELVQRFLKGSRALDARGAQVWVPGSRQLVRIVVLGTDAQPELRVFDEPRPTERLAGNHVHVGHAEGEAHDRAFGAALVGQGVRASRKRGDGKHALGLEQRKAMRKLGAARVADQQHARAKWLPQNARQLIEVVSQPANQPRVLVCDLVRVGPVAVLDRRRDHQPAVAIGMRGQMAGKQLAVAAQAVERDEHLRGRAIRHRARLADVDGMNARWERRVDRAGG